MSVETFQGLVEGAGTPEWSIVTDVAATRCVCSLRAQFSGGCQHVYDSWAAKGLRTLHCIEQRKIFGVRARGMEHDVHVAISKAQSNFEAPTYVVHCDLAVHRAFGGQRGQQLTTCVETFLGNKKARVRPRLCKAIGHGNNRDVGRSAQRTWGQRHESTRRRTTTCQGRHGPKEIKAFQQLLVSCTFHDPNDNSGHSHGAPSD